MLKNLDNKQKAYGTLIVLVVISLIFWFFSDIFSTWAATSNAFLVMIVSILLNPAYILLIYWLYTQYSFRGIFSGILISIGIDIISLTHSISKAGTLPLSSEAYPLYGYADTTLYKIISHLIGSNPAAAFILYVIIPGLLFYIALRIIRRTASFNRILKQAM